MLEGEEGQEKLELKAAYAYDRQKYFDKTVHLGEGVIGQCVLEKATTHLREIPENFINIKSGLGDAHPRSILMVPLISNEEVHGVMEVASFKNFGDYQIEFLELLCESIASVIDSAKSNEMTRNLLKETQEMGENMRLQEEAMMQNMEELATVHEEMERKQEAMEIMFAEVQQENEKLKGKLKDLGEDSEE